MYQYLKTMKMEQKYMNKRDLWQEYINLKGGDFEAWFRSLNHSEKQEFTQLQESSKEGDSNRKLLNG